ncbi:hypothetical protein SAMN02745152_02100 [Treponema berlinense]|uniref:Uncharacterized protein n=1 Tax=Treponema berlinense TaxID=225004 RepID=A0A1T4QSY4_9SPIR|nr:hypothetical protein [Treponema berlinense]SKA06830.1 hypothetical protein SAMN02745152_02100 [Treponema berlinense]
MAISEKKLKEIRKGFDKSNRLVMNLYRRNGDTSLLEMLYLDSENPQEVADEFDIPLEIAEKLVERDNAIKENPLEAMSETSGKLFAGISAILGKPEKSELYDKAFEFVASSGNEEPAALAEALEITVEQATSLIEEMRLHGDIASDDDGEEASEETANDESEDFNDDSDDDFDADLSDFPEKVIEALAFVGDVIQDTSEKICDVLDESVEKFQEHDFDF